MKLEHKITVVTLLISLSVLTSLMVLYNNISYNEVIKNQQDVLSMRAKRFSDIILNNFHDHIANTLTISTTPLIKENLIKSNESYKNRSENEIKKHIKSLNDTWMASEEKSDFIQSYLTNNISNFLKLQQTVLPSIYGEIFLTNAYGEMIATTGKLTTLAHSHKYWWKKAYNDSKGKIFLDDRGYDESVGSYVIGVVVPVVQDGNIIGILKANIQIIDTMGKIIKEYNSIFESEVYIARTNGLVVFQENIEPLSNKLSKDIQKEIKNNTDPISKQIIDGKEYMVSHTVVNTSKLNFNYSVGFGGKAKTIDHKYGNEGEQWHVIIQKPMDTILKNHYKNNKQIMILGFVLLFISLFIAYVAARSISKKQYELEQKLENYNKTLENEVEEKTAELDSLNRNLQQEVQKKTQENFKQYQVLQQQSKLAAMGEILGSIAHQWRQPLNALSLAILNFQRDYKKKTLDDDLMDEFISKSTHTISFMSKTIDDFRDFFLIDKEKQEFDVKLAIEELLALQGALLKSHNIAVNIEGTSFNINGYKSEFMQVVMNIINNAKDAFIKNETTHPVITITLKNKTIKLLDNAGGIDEDMIEKIFEPYFTTKHKSQGAGMGLYIAKMIIEDNMDGKISVFSDENGATFTLSWFS